MSKENMREYISFLWEMNKPMYECEMDGVREQLGELERKLTLKQMADIEFLCDVDLCERYGLKPNEINPKYVDYVLDKDDKIIEEKMGNITVVTERKVLNSSMKTNFLGMRANLIRQIRESEL